MAVLSRVLFSLVVGLMRGKVFLWKGHTLQICNFTTESSR